MRPRHLAALQVLLAAGLATPALAIHAGRRCITCERLAESAAVPRAAAPAVAPAGAPDAAMPRDVRRDVVRRAEAATPRRSGCPQAAPRTPR